MKKLLLTTFLILAVSSISLLHAQGNNSKISILRSDKFSISGSNGSITTLQGNVVISSDKLSITKADSVVINKDSNKLIVFGYSEFTFQGKIVAASNRGGKPARLEYNIGEDVLYLLD